MMKLTAPESEAGAVFVWRYKPRDFWHFLSGIDKKRGRMAGRNWQIRRESGRSGAGIRRETGKWQEMGAENKGNEAELDKIRVLTPGFLALGLLEDGSRRGGNLPEFR